MGTWKEKHTISETLPVERKHWAVANMGNILSTADIQYQLRESKTTENAEKNPNFQP